MRSALFYRRGNYSACSDFTAESAEIAEKL